MARRITTEEFIDRCRSIHGDRYDYSSVDYISQIKKISITCPEHGEFFQIAGNHLRGSICSKCNAKKISEINSGTTVKFINKAREKHGEKYDYSSVEYRNSNDKVRILCKLHGVFTQRASHHLNGTGCPACAKLSISKNRSDTKESFIKKAIERHGDVYSYDNVIYEKSNKKVKITCLAHGDFEQTPSAHLKGNRCPKCAQKNNREKNYTAFIEEALRIHGGKYNYDKVNYLSVDIKVEIICSKHGSFYQSPKSHMSGSGCPQCGLVRRANTQSLGLQKFISISRATHGTRYSYDLVEYKKNKEKVIIICPKHGKFKQAPSNHMSGQGCPSCGGTEKLSRELFIRKAEAIHEGKYDYSKMRHTAGAKKVTIICPKHGEFLQQAQSHLQGIGCRECAGTKPLGQHGFIDKASAVHVNKYDYSEAEYVNIIQPLLITCPEHGVFSQKPVHHLNGAGCPSCAGNIALSNSEFIARAKEIHSNKYEYENAFYESSTSQIIISCPDHGEFRQMAASHLNGSGCRQCANFGFKLEEPGVLYYLRIDAPDMATPLYKIGITNNSVNKRFSGEMQIITTLAIEHFEKGIDALEREQKLLIEHQDFKYHGEKILRQGNTELFTKDVLGLDSN